MQYLPGNNEAKANHEDIYFEPDDYEEDELEIGD